MYTSCSFAAESIHRTGTSTQATTYIVCRFYDIVCIDSSVLECVFACLAVKQIDRCLSQSVVVCCKHCNSVLPIALSSTASQNNIGCLQIETEQDELWGPDFREEKEQIKARGAKFMQWLMSRPEQRIAVVSHSSFLFFTLANYGLHASTLVQVSITRINILHKSAYTVEDHRQC